MEDAKIIGNVYRVIYNCHAEEWGYDNPDFGPRRSELVDHGEKVVIYSHTVSGRVIEPLIYKFDDAKTFYLCHAHFENKHPGLGGLMAMLGREYRTLGQIMAEVATDFPNQYESYTCAIINRIRELFELERAYDADAGEHESDDDESPES